MLLVRRGEEGVDELAGPSSPHLTGRGGEGEEEEERQERGKKREMKEECRRGGEERAYVHVIHRQE